MAKKIVFAALLLVVVMVAAASLRNSDMGHLNPGLGKTLVDVHVHVAGLGYGDSDSFINETMRDNYRFPFYLWAYGVTLEELEEHGDRVLIDKLSRNIAQSEAIASAVLLAMDGYVELDGTLNRGMTQMYVSNEFVARETKDLENLRFGASVNPNRTDAIERLRRAKQQGALLIKWIPSIMNIDPADPRHIPFYQAMAELNIPLLSHTGMEKSFAGARDELADPKRLELPLKHGVTVIAAHIATTGESEGQDNFQRILPMIKEYDNLYVDVSSLTQINKLGYLAKAMDVEGIMEKMIYGTDWPLQFFPLVSPWYHLNHISLRDAWRVSGIQNQWDRDVALKVAYGLPDEVFKRGERVLNIGSENAAP